MRISNVLWATIVHMGPIYLYLANQVNIVVLLVSVTQMEDALKDTIVKSRNTQ